MEVVLEDDPDERKYFDQGKPTQSKCAEKDLPIELRFPGEAIKDFDAVSKAIDATIAKGGHALVHCHASLSRSVAFILAHLMRTRGLSLLGAAKLMKPKWDAVWPCDVRRLPSRQLSSAYRLVSRRRDRYTTIAHRDSSTSCVCTRRSSRRRTASPMAASPPSVPATCFSAPLSMRSCHRRASPACHIGWVAGQKNCGRGRGVRDWGAVGRWIHLISEGLMLLGGAGRGGSYFVCIFRVWPSPNPPRRPISAHSIPTSHSTPT